MDETKKFVAFDLGAESGRCFVAVLHGEKFELHEICRFETPTFRRSDGFQWDITRIYEEVLDGLTKARADFGACFDGIGIDSWGVDYVLMDQKEAILGKPFHYRDDRTDGMMQQAFKVIPKEELYRMTGTQFAQFNTLFQLLAEKKSKQNLLKRASTLLMIPDYLNYMLSGVKRTEFSIASTTALTDPKTRNWSWDIINAFGLPKKIFPRIVEPGTALGPLSAQVAERTGLDLSTPVIATTGHDTASAVVSVPVSKSSWAYLSSGTWSLLGVELEKPKLSSRAMNFNFTNEGGFERTTRFLKNIVGLWPLQECRRLWGQESNLYSYSELATLASGNGYAGSWLNLDDPRFSKKCNTPDLINVYLNETGQQNKQDVGFITRVILESLAFSYRKTLKEIETLTDTKIDVLHAVGGGVQNDLLSQLTADAIGRPVLAGPVEGAVIGNVGVQAIAVGAVADLKRWREIATNSMELRIFKPKDRAYFDKNEITYDKVASPRNHELRYKMALPK